MESFDQYRQRLFGYVGERDPLEVQRGTAARLQALAASLPEGDLAKEPAPGKWSVAHILAHLADAELVIGFRLRSALASSGVAIQAYDQDRWADALRWGRTPAAHSLERFRVLRAWNVALLETLGEEEWERYGIHAERGRESVRDMTRLTAGHDLNHTMQIERIAGAR